MDAVQKAPLGNGDPARSANLVAGCPLTAALAAIGGKRKLIIMYWLGESPRHFAALQRAIPGISPKVLTQQLRELERQGLVSRRPTGPVPAPIEYSLTDYGHTVVPVVEAVRHWGRGHLSRVEAA